MSKRRQNDLDVDPTTTTTKVPFGASNRLDPEPMDEDMGEFEDPWEDELESEEEDSGVEEIIEEGEEIIEEGEDEVMQNGKNELNYLLLMRGMHVLMRYCKSYAKDVNSRGLATYTVC